MSSRASVTIWSSFGYIEATFCPFGFVIFASSFSKEDSAAFDIFLEIVSS